MDAEDHEAYNQGTLKPLKRNKIKRENSETDLGANGQPGYQDGHEQNGAYPNFNQKYQPGMYNDHGEDSAMIGREINQNNAFEQTYEDLLPKLR